MNPLSRPRVAQPLVRWSQQPYLRPITHFIQSSSAGGILLMMCAILALVWANSPFDEGYFALWQTVVTVGGGPLVISKPLLLWINDGLMALFFFVVGLEIKREVLVGELSSPRNAALPLAAAIGGMVVPALIYLAFNRGTSGASGWGVPMATDIAFALGVLALLGKRVPLSLKIFVMALAIVDDLGAVMVIALFYTEKITPNALIAAGGFLAALVLLNVAGVRRPLPYTIFGIALWVAVLKSGVHATIAGVVLAMTIPATARIDLEGFIARARRILDEMSGPDAADELPEEDTVSAHELEQLCERVESPLQRLEHMLQPWVAFFIMPIFALANAGVALGGSGLSALGSPVALGVALGLVAGKLLGVLGFSVLAVKTGLAQLPSGVTWRHIFGASWLCGIGFTMSLFIANLAFDAALLDTAKIGILAASLVAGVVGFAVLRATPPETTESTVPTRELQEV